MLQQGNGSFRLFKAFGIQVWLHWTWFIAAAWLISARKNTYSSPSWMVWEYLAIFGIVLLHEFGHALACRSVGGRAEDIILWPLGGVAFVQPPPRPGAVLWSIAAGPLVNVLLVPILYGLLYLGISTGYLADAPNTARFLHEIAGINLVLLVFNVLPIYPLDGGQIVQSLLWFVVGYGRSLLIASLIGLLGGAGLAVYAFAENSTWLVIMALFLLSRAWQGFQAAQQWQKAMAARGTKNYE